MTKTKPLSLSEIRRAFPVGTRVAFYPVRGLARFEISEVQSEAWTLGHGQTVVKINGRPGGVCASHLALATDKQPPEIANRLAKGRISVRAHGKRFRAMIDKLPLHADIAPQGFDSRDAAADFAKSIRQSFLDA